jgi:hypothetical protein
MYDNSPAVVARGRSIVADLDAEPSTQEAIDAAMRYACERRGRSVMAIRAERSRVLKSRNHAGLSDASPT